MRNKGKILILILLLITVKVLWGITYLQVGEIQDNVWLITEDKTIGLTEQNLRELNQINEKQEEKLEYVFWNEVEGSVTSIPGNRTEACDVVISSERVDILFHDSVPFYSNKNECIVSRDLADRLFGSYDIEGLSIKFGERVYRIREVSESLQEGMIIHVVDSQLKDQEEQISFENITIQNTESIGDSAIEDKVESFLGVQLKHLDLKFEFFIMQLIYLISIFILIRRLGILLKNKTKTKILGIVILFIIIDLCIVFCFYSIPIDFVPNKMSDRLFWQELFQFEKENYHSLFVMKKLIPLRSWFELRLELGFLLITNIILLFSFDKHFVRRKDERKLNIVNTKSEEI